MNIVTREHIRERARRAFKAGRSRDDHGMNPGAHAIATWQAEHDRLSSEARFESQREGIPQLHGAPAGVLRVDHRQEGA